MEEQWLSAYNSTTEKAVISCMIQDESACETGLLSLTREHFLDADCARVFSAISLAHKQGFEVGLQSVCSIVDNDFIPTVVEIYTNLPTSANFEVYLKTLQEDYRNRQFVNDFTALIERAKNGDEEIISETPTSVGGKGDTSIINNNYPQENTEEQSVLPDEYKQVEYIIKTSLFHVIKHFLYLSIFPESFFLSSTVYIYLVA